MKLTETSFLDLGTALLGALIGALLLYAAWVSRREGETRATRVALLLALCLPLPYFAGALLERPALAGFLLLGTLAALVVLLLPIGGDQSLDYEEPRKQIDEREIMFSRRLLEPGTPRFERYYTEFPEQRAPDDAFRSKPGLLQPGSSAHHPLAFPAADASFWTIAQLKAHVDGDPAPSRTELHPGQISRFLKRWTLELGAHSVGITRLEEHHKYSRIGRGAQYGEPVRLDHECAIALTVEMDKTMVDCAPLAGTVMESAQEYLKSGNIAVQLAAFIRGLGYRARAHIDGNYRVLCPLVARDAGLGEIGRMGLLMTPRLGPRVRIAVVTTDFPLELDERRPDPSLIDFCRHCEKCATACPGLAIPKGDRSKIEGVRRWQISQEKCFTFWCQVGTDCARCVKVCPYSHPDNFLHNAVRLGIRRSLLFRRIALRLDDLFYGKLPPPARMPEWLKVDRE